MVGFLVILFFVVCAIIVVVSHSKCLDSELDDYVSNTLSKGIKPSKSICIQVGTSKIMLREDFIKREWNKEKDGIPVRGEYEPTEHFMKRINAYRKRKDQEKRQYDINEKTAKEWQAITHIPRKDGEGAFHYMVRVKPYKDKILELTRKQQSIKDGWKRDIPKSEYEADEILKNYNGSN